MSRASALAASPAPWAEAWGAGWVRSEGGRGGLELDRKSVLQRTARSACRGRSCEWPAGSVSFFCSARRPDKVSPVADGGTARLEAAARRLRLFCSSSRASQTACSRVSKLTPVLSSTKLTAYGAAVSTVSAESGSALRPAGVKRVVREAKLRPMTLQSARAASGCSGRARVMSRTSSAELWLRGRGWGGVGGIRCEIG